MLQATVCNSDTGPMPVLTHRPEPHRANSWLIHYGDVRVGTIARAVGTPDTMTQ